MDIEDFSKLSNLWILIITIWLFFIGFWYIRSFNKVFEIIPINLSVTDVLVRSLPSLSIIIISIIYILADPIFPWSESITKIKLKPETITRDFLQLTTSCIIVATLIGKFRAWRFIRFAKRSYVYTDIDVCKDVIVVSVSKDFLSCYQPEVRKCYVIPMSKVLRVETLKTPVEWRIWRKFR